MYLQILGVRKWATWHCYYSATTYRKLEMIRVLFIKFWWHCLKLLLFKYMFYLSLVFWPVEKTALYLPHICVLSVWPHWNNQENIVWANEWFHVKLSPKTLEGKKVNYWSIKNRSRYNGQIIISTAHKRIVSSCVLLSLSSE